MRLVHTSTSNRRFEDRNPEKLVLSYSGAISAPDAGSIRGSVTVPAGKKLFIEGVRLSASRTTISTAQKLVKAKVTLNTGTVNFPIMQLEENLAIVGSRGVVEQSVQIFANSGHIIELHTEDPAVDGAITWDLQFFGTIFDAL